MERISGNSDNSLLLSQLQSNSAIKNAAKPDDEAQPAIGNMLQSFGGILQEQMQHINDLQATANQAEQTYAVGGDIELHNVILAAEKADLALQLAMQVRNKAVAAYQEITHMNL